MLFSSDTSKSGTFTSLNYPSEYPEGVTCNYHFSGSGKERIQIFFNDFDLYSLPDDSRLMKEWVLNICSSFWHALIEHFNCSCEETDSLLVLVAIGGNKERIDNFCGHNMVPSQLMSNGPTLKVEFKSFPRALSGSPNSPSVNKNSSALVGVKLPSHSTPSSGTRGTFRGFRATYSFITSEWSFVTHSLPLCPVTACCRSLEFWN